MSEMEERVEARFGVLPNFFRLAPETPETHRQHRFKTTAMGTCASASLR
jgi:hypothetical protein